jgi:hypothetical protein
MLSRDRGKASSRQPVALSLGRRSVGVGLPDAEALLCIANDIAANINNLTSLSIIPSVNTPDHFFQESKKQNWAKNT